MIKLWRGALSRGGSIMLCGLGVAWQFFPGRTGLGGAGKRSGMVYFDDSMAWRSPRLYLQFLFPKLARLIWRRKLARADRLQRSSDDLRALASMSVDQIADRLRQDGLIS